MRPKYIIRDSIGRLGGAPPAFVISLQMIGKATYEGADRYLPTVVASVILLRPF